MMSAEARIQQIEQHAAECFGRGSVLYNGFMTGAMWADEHPDLSQFWHDAYEEPEIGSNIIVVDKYGQWWEIQPYDGEYDGYGDLTGWECCVVHYNNIQRWAYISDLLPRNTFSNEKS